jgi:nitric oxide reductase NorD protein
MSTTPVSLADELALRHEPMLRGFGTSLPEELATAAQALEGRLSAEELEHWAEAGVTLARRSLRSWEAAQEYFRASPAAAETLATPELLAWAVAAGSLADRSSLVAAAYLRSTPGVLRSLPAADLEPWARQGERLCQGSWKSIALATIFYQSSPELLESLTLAQLARLVDVVEALAERSYELATRCLEAAAQVLAPLSPADREPFLEFAWVLTRASWADTRIYFERAPALLAQVDPAVRTAFIELAAQVTESVGRQGFPLFAGAADALREVDRAEHPRLLGFAHRLAASSPVAAMEYLKSAPAVHERLTAEQMERWSDAGLELLLRQRNVEGAEAFFRLESARAEQLLASLSARVELTAVSSTLRLYAKALTGQSIAVHPVEELAEKGIGWVTGAATTEGTAIYLPESVSSFPDQRDNFQVYKVFATHQTGRIEFGSFRYRHGEPGAHTLPVELPAAPGAPAAAAPGTPLDAPADAEPAEGERPAPLTEMQRLYDGFPDRSLIAALFTIVEDTRVDACVAREYRGIREWLRRVQEAEAARRPDARSMPLRRAYVEALLRASIGAPQSIEWPARHRGALAQGLAALRLVEQPDATVQDSAAVAAAIYRLAAALPNERLEEEEEWISPDEEMLTIAPAMPSGGAADGAPQPVSGEEAFESPPQPDFRGDFKPELVQLLMRLREGAGEGEGDGRGTPLTAEQLQELLENSTELMISEMAEGDLASTVSLFLTNLERETSLSSGGQEPTSGERGGEGEEEEPPPEEPAAPEIEYFQYDEWDFRAGDYRPRWCTVGERTCEEGDLDFYEETLARHHGLVTETRRQFELMRPESFRKIKRLEDGEDIDLDQAIEFLIDKRAGVGPLARFYYRRNKVERDVAVSFLLDMSASTDEEIDKKRQKYDEDDDFDGDPSKYFQWLAQRRSLRAADLPKRIIDLEKESAVLLVEALEAIGDAYGIYGFSGYGRENVEFYVVKDLDEPFSDRVRRRIAKIEPVRSTRMGPAIRHATHKLAMHDAKVRILVLVSDGRPQDHGYGRDRTEKEYAVHDTKQALLEARRAGITPFLITVDKEGHDYLKQMCDDIGYEVVTDIEQLPRRLTTLYRALAGD